MNKILCNQSFTHSGDSAADHLLQNMLQQLQDRLQFCPKGTEIYLGGSYGRGDGSVFRNGDRTGLYNDLDFFVFLPFRHLPKRAEVDRALEKLAVPWREQLGIDVDFSPAKGPLELICHGKRLMYQELKHGNVPVLGNGDFLRLIPELPPGQLPIEEGFRLLLNRGMGFLLAVQELRTAAPDADFVLRNFSKLVFGCSDALLIACGQYRWERRRRRELLQSLLSPEDYALYSRADAFKARPFRKLPEDQEQTVLSLKDFFLRTVRLITGSDASADDILPALTSVCRRHHACSPGHWLNTARRTGSWSLSADHFLPPTVQLLGMLYNHMTSSTAPLLPVPAALHRLWLLFN